MILIDYVKSPCIYFCVCLFQALVNATLQISGASSKEEEDIKRYKNCVHF